MEGSKVPQKIAAMLEFIERDDARLDEFFSQIEPIWVAYSQLDDSLCDSADGYDLIEKLITASKNAFGFWGYAYWVVVAFSAHGEGEGWHELNDGVEQPLTLQKCQAIYDWISNNVHDFDSELLALVRRHKCIGLPFDHERSQHFLADVKMVANKYFALVSDDEYDLILSVIDVPPYKFGDGYALYTFNALRHSLSNRR
jgi:hypothetical protein